MFGIGKSLTQNPTKTYLVICNSRLWENPLTTISQGRVAKSQGSWENPAGIYRLEYMVYMT